MTDPDFDDMLVKMKEKYEFRKERYHDEVPTKQLWETVPLLVLLRKMKEEVDELLDALYNEDTAEEIQGECVDVANVCAMIWTRCKEGK